MPARRIIVCLDVRAGRVVKGVRFEGHRDMGDPVERARHYRDAGADEIVIYDITASVDRRTLTPQWLETVARALDVPLSVAGGIRTVDQALACLAHGADKVSINSPALERPNLIDELARLAGSQCVVVGVDSRWAEGDWWVHQYTGDVTTNRRTPRRMLDWIKEAEARGAGEIVLNCMDQDGVRQGYDLDQLAAARERLSIPLIASGGAGTPTHFAEVFARANVSGALAAGLFHRGDYEVADVKRAVAAAGVEVRP